MTRFAIDAPVALRLVRGTATVAEGHQLVGAAALRSDAMAILYSEVRVGSLAEKDARTLLEGVAGLKIRLLGDRGSRALAWRIATARGWDDVRRAELLAVASLQADALVTEDAALAADADGIVPLASVGDLAR
ncbi:hypothetical protein ACFT5B_09565 [Luteimicrobium sp. NPDC057192]|uniref:hypothetical protein n=1 Tax=Luteimicrobium sp. NPDC057192 TaxID=3346042 RepID=UPI00364561A4